MLGNVARVLEGAADLGDALDDGAEIADRDALVQEQLQHALDAGGRDVGRHDLLDEFAVLLGQLLQELLHLHVREELGHVALDDLGEVGRHDGGGVDHGVAAELRLVAQAVVDPGRRQPEGRLQHMVAGQLHLPAHRIHGHVQVREDLRRRRPRSP